jgi:hypothetical protein
VVVPVGTGMSRTFLLSIYKPSIIMSFCDREPWALQEIPSRPKCKDPCYRQQGVSGSYTDNPGDVASGTGKESWQGINDDTGQTVTTDKTRSVGGKSKSSNAANSYAGCQIICGILAFFTFLYIITV